MHRFLHLSIKSRLILMLLAVSLLSILVIGYLGWSNGRRALHEAIFAHLTSVRASKAHQIEDYFSRTFAQTAMLADNRMVVEAMVQFGDAYRDVQTWPLLPAWEAEVDNFYEETFLPRLAERVEGPPLFAVYRPQAPAATYLQYHYIAANPYPVDQKEDLVDASEDQSSYGVVHRRLHPLFTKMLERFGYYDLFLVDIDTGAVVYSVRKETEFATSLYDGPYLETNFAQMVDAIQEAPEPGVVHIADFRPYRPSYATPAAFVGAPIYNGAEAVGVLALQVPVNEIDRVMTSDGTWSAIGLGQSGESYLVGGDLRMRSVSRFLIEDESGYLNLLQEINLEQETISRIRQFGTTTLLQPVNTQSVQNALRGETGTQVFTGYRGVAVLSSYAPLSIPGLDWVILAEIEAAEAFAPVRRLERNLLISGVLLVVVVTLAAVLLSRVFVRPVDMLIAGVRRVGAGAHDATIDLRTEDEFGDLAVAFNTMVADLRDQTARIEEKNAENERLLLNILPAPIAQRLKAGEQVAEQLQQVSVIFIRILGFAGMAQRHGARRSAQELNQLINTLDEVAARFEIERIKTIAETYVAACGLTTTRLDHAKRSVDFAVEAMQIIRQFDLEQGESLAVQIGIATGPVIAGVVGTHKFRYELWGETVNTGHCIHLVAPPNCILVTQEVFDRVHTLYDLEKHEAVVCDGTHLDVWQVTLSASVTSRTPEN